MSDPVDSCHFDGIFQQKYNFRDWIITTRRSHILESKCSNSCPKDAELKDKCLYCQYEEQFKNIPHFPDMTFAKNLLHVVNKKGFGIGFDCLNALKSLSYSSPQDVKVDSSEDWLKARSDCEHTKKVLRPFDWTFTTNYKGHFLSDDPHLQFEVEPTEERINIERLKVKDDILFFDDVHLFEDELADNGVAQLSVKIRVMRDIMFILLRYFLRVDKVKVRLCDTRIYYEAGKNYLLREFTSREQDLTSSTLSTEVLLDPVELSKCLPLKDFCNEKLIFPK